MWPRYIQVSFNFAGTGLIFQYVFLQSCICLQITILRHPVVTSEIHSYLQNSNSTFFLIYAYDFRQHTTSPPFTYASLIKTQPNQTTFHDISNGTTSERRPIWKWSVLCGTISRQVTKNKTKPSLTWKWSVLCGTISRQVTKNKTKPSLTWKWSVLCGTISRQVTKNETKPSLTWKWSVLCGTISHQVTKNKTKPSVT